MVKLWKNKWDTSLTQILLQYCMNTKYISHKFDMSIFQFFFLKFFFSEDNYLSFYKMQSPVNFIIKKESFDCVVIMMQ